MTTPFYKNSCAGHYSDWLEVMLTPDCNARCEFCCEKDGYKPEHKASVKEIARKIIASGKKNVNLLGGEPTLYDYLDDLIRLIWGKVNIYLTTNGSKLAGYHYVFMNNLNMLKGLNISIHHYDERKNFEITGVMVNYKLEESVRWLIDKGVEVRLNCNLIKGYIDTWAEIECYIEWAKDFGIKNFRFSELENCDDKFVDIVDITGYHRDPFTEGCSDNVKFDDVNINWRYQCGLYTKHRPYPKDAEFPYKKKVLYYDGKFYDGWQTKQKEATMEYKQKILSDFKEGKISQKKCLKLLEDNKENRFCPKCEQKIEPTHGRGWVAYWDGIWDDEKGICQACSDKEDLTKDRCENRGDKKELLSEEGFGLTKIVVTTMKKKAILPKTKEFMTKSKLAEKKNCSCENTERLAIELSDGCSRTGRHGGC